MAQQLSPREVALAFTNAWTSHDLDTAAGYLADDVEFDGPMAGHTTGKQAYMEGLAAFARTVTGGQILAAFGDDAQALIMCDLTTAPFGVLRTAELLSVRDGQIHDDKLTFDTYRLRQAEAGQAAPSSTP